MANQAKSAAGRILHNSFWYGLEQILETVVFLGTSIAVARYFGPDKLGYFSYINFFVNIITRTSGTGLAGATRKYMAEFLALDRPGTAHAVYRLAYKYQLLASVSITALFIAGVWLFGEREYQVMSTILLLSIVPGVMSWVPAQANQAFEDVFENTISALGYIFSYALMIFLTLHFGWGLIGIASALLVGRTTEVILRTVPLHRRLALMPLDTLEKSLTDRIRTFCLQALGIQLLMSVVWDRSELWFLKYFAPWVTENGVTHQNLSQLGFYSVSFTIANNLLVIPRTFSSATGITLMVESVREPGRIDSIVKNASRFLLLVVIPVHIGAAAIAAQALGFTYGPRYLQAVPIVIVASLLAMPRAFQEIAEVLLRAADKQRQILIWFTITGVLNVALDLFLIPRYGAVGAAWGNGLSQTFGIMAIWRQARRYYSFSFPLWNAARLLAAGLAMGAVAWAIVSLRPLTDFIAHQPIASGLLAASIAASVLVYLVGVKLVRGLQPSDRNLLAMIASRLPVRAQKLYLSGVAFVTPAPQTMPLAK